MSPTMFIGRVMLAGRRPGRRGQPCVELREEVRGSGGIHRGGSDPRRSESNLPDRIIAEGRVVAYPGAEVTVGTEVVGTIISVPVHENAVVRKGDLLVELRADDVKASLREAHFRLIEAETGLRLLRARFQLDRLFPVAGRQLHPLALPSGRRGSGCGRSPRRRQGDG